METMTFEKPGIMNSETVRPRRLLVVDDEIDLCEILQFNLEREGYIVETANSAEEVLKLELEKFDLLLLDVMLGEISGFNLANTINKDEQGKHIPIIFITAKSSEEDTLTGFNLGAEDYITKPFLVKEVIARIKVALRHIPSSNEHRLPLKRIGNLDIYSDEKRLEIEGHTVPLTKKEFEILFLLCEHPGKVFTREEILTRIWESESYILDRTVDVNITRLRKKIGKYSSKIVTRQGYGYCFEPER